MLFDRTSPLVDAPLESECEAIVVIPVRNEQESILGCLSAFGRQQDVQLQNFEIILLVNNSTDTSEQQALNFAAVHRDLRLHVISREFSADQANIGTVRRTLMDEASRRFLQYGHRGGIILTTDGDTIVDSDWVTSNLKEFRNGADAVGGRISLNAEEMHFLSPRVRRLYRLDVMHGLLRAELESKLDPVPWDPWPRHHQNFCASFGVTAATYSLVGGIPAGVTVLEDVSLCNSMLNRGCRIRHSPHVKVRTSARLYGRVGEGLSSHLRSFEGGQLMVENITLAAQRFRASRTLRTAAVTRSEKESVYRSLSDQWRDPREVPVEAAVVELLRLLHAEARSY